MADPNTVFDRVDALIRPDGSGLGGRRRRSFVAAASDRTESLAQPFPTIEDDDLPVLTEVVAIEEPVAAPAPTSDRVDETLLSIVAADLVHSIEHQLAIELPTLIEATLLNAQNELRTGVNSTLEMALRDFLARRQQLRLPLENPNEDN